MFTTYYNKTVNVYICNLFCSAFAIMMFTKVINENIKLTFVNFPCAQG